MIKAPITRAQRTVGPLLIALIFLLGMAAAHPGLHQALHQSTCYADDCEQHQEGDTEDSEHTCGVTLLQTGSILLIDAPTIDALGTVRETVQFFNEIAFTLISFCLPQGRAPPIAGIV